ncbi:NAD-dependent epimerase/dehydratase family protein [Parafrankia sp. FMc2]|uniref:NAD-dependent epimerase/dehydratase family protein n=1 Tax=Parafrankia sp. FMc2 TaxID=3233196 RepID=UPI0034D7B3DD
MRILVLGGTNFIGRHIVARLIERHDVAVLNRGRNPIWGQQAEQLQYLRGFQLKDQVNAAGQVLAPQRPVRGRSCARRRSR